MSLFAKKTANPRYTNYEELERKETAAIQKALAYTRSWYDLTPYQIAELPTADPKKQDYYMYRFYFNCAQVYARRKNALTLAQAELRRR